MDRFESMTTFGAAVKAGSLSAAARQLGMPLATVSRKVSELEEHLGTRLLVRSSRHLSLTDAGRSYLAACTRILEELNEAERAASGEFGTPKGELVIAAPIVLGRLHVLPVVSAFLKAFPEVDVRLALSDRVTNLLEDHIDVAVRVGELPDSSLLATRLGAMQRVVCGSPRYFAQRGTPKRLEDLAEHECVTCEGVSPSHAWTFREAKRKVVIQVHSRLVVTTAEAAIDAAIDGVGVTRVWSYQVAAAERAGKLVRVLGSFEKEPTPVSLVYSGQALLPRKLRAFLDFSGPRLKARLSA